MAATLQRATRSCASLHSDVPVAVRVSLLAGVGSASHSVELSDLLLMDAKYAAGAQRRMLESQKLAASPPTPSTAATTEEDRPSRKVSSASSSTAAEEEQRAPKSNTVVKATSMPRDHTRSKQLVATSDDPMLRARFVGAFLNLARLPVSEEVTRRFLAALVLFRRLKYADTDILSVAAHASAYSACIQQRSSGAAVDQELGPLLVVCLYAAHGYVMDLHCPARLWFIDVLDKRCSMKAFNRAIMHLMRLRGYRLRLTDRSLSERFNNLKTACSRER